MRQEEGIRKAGPGAAGRMSAQEARAGRLRSVRSILLLAMLLVLAFAVPAQAKTAKNYRPAQAASWISRQAGKTVNYWNPPSNAQCTELVYHYYRHLGADGPDVDAWQYSEVRPPSGWKRIPYYEGFTAQMGDVAVWTGGRYGHVALIVEPQEGGFLSLDQNMNGRHFASFCTHTYGTEGSLRFWGVIRPNFKKGRKDPHGTGKGRKLRPAVYYYAGGARTLVISRCSVWYRGGRKGGSFVVWYGDQLLDSSCYKVRYTLNRRKKTMTCVLQGKGAWKKCRGKITVPVT